MNTTAATTSKATATKATATKATTNKTTTNPGTTTQLESLDSVAMQSIGGRKAFTRPIDFDAKHFDIVAYLPKARAYARSLVPDAELSTMTTDTVEA